MSEGKDHYLKRLKLIGANTNLVTVAYKKDNKAFTWQYLGTTRNAGGAILVGYTQNNPPVLNDTPTMTNRTDKIVTGMMW